MGRKRIGSALIAIAIVGLFFGGMVYAYFSDIERIDNNAFVAGTLDLVPGEGTLSPVNMGPVFPGWGTEEYPDSMGDARKTLTVVNDGNVGGVLTIKFLQIINDGGETTEPEQALGEDNGELGANLYVVIKYDGVELRRATLDSLEDEAIYLGVLYGGDEGTITIEYYVLPDVGNEIQGDEVTFDILLSLDQIWS